MYRYTYPLLLASSISLLYLLNPSYISAQITPDATLGQESSVVTPNVEINGISSTQIDGGAIRDTNLFHSFEQFSIDAGEGAYFTNPIGIENILSRVTGNSPSNILGTLGVLGNANLFLINPNGIIFGSNASLDLNGSFVATTADAIGLGESGLFSASEPAASNLLTIEPSVLFFNQLTAKTIVNQSQAESLKGETNSVGTPVGLQVPTGQTMALVGGDLVIEGGNLTATGGHIELGSVAGVGEVSITGSGNSLAFGYDAVDAFGEIQIKGALVDVSGEGGGSLQIQGSQLLMSQGAAIFADTLGTETGQGVLINTTEAVTLSENSLITANANILSSGAGGDLSINTGNLIVQDGSLISTTTFGEGKGGNLSVKTRETVQLLGVNEFGDPSALFAGTLGFAPSGNLTIETTELLIRGGAQATTITFGESNAGDLIVRASVVELVGDASVETSFSSGLFAQTDQDSTGNGGNLTLETEQLIITNGAQIAASTFGGGNAGNLSVKASEVRLIGTRPSLETSSGFVASGIIAGAQADSAGKGGSLTLTTERLIIQDGADVQVSTLGDGDAGELIVRASESIELIGTTPDGQFSSALRAVSGLEGVATEVKGNAGNLNIFTPDLIVRDGAEVTVSATGEGVAGSLEVEAESIRLDNGSLRAETRAGNQGNITLDAQDIILRRGSDITTNAILDATGGNITINTDILAALEDSDITARAVRGSGGNIDITTQGIFLSPDSEINASSQIGIDGTVTITTPEVDPTSGILELPSTPIDAESIVAKNPCAIKEGKIAGGSSFVITGRGGLPPSADDPLPHANRVVEWASRPSQQVSSPVVLRQRVQTNGQGKRRYPVIEQAQGWMVAPDGTIILTATLPNVMPQSPGLIHPHCRLSSPLY
ncbi:MAG: S-layer family protein [Symploca sp. SIO2E9]|nr:S-layer family protein [Symploca sp. SIO2E9]